MKWVLLIPIRLYWRLWPTAWKRNCLFTETCSRFVYRTTKSSGLRAGWSALLLRYKTCRSNGPLTAIFPPEQRVAKRGTKKGNLWLHVESVMEKAL
jgi:putative component of membrane protein insertase Oxa1/YidC/SpoIIIJ protein YidD